MNDEWDVVRGYITDLVAKAPDALSGRARLLETRFVEIEAERRGAKALLTQLAVHGATINLVADQVWQSAEDSFQRRWRDSLSDAGDLGIAIRRATARGKRKSIDHGTDRQIAFDAVLRKTLKQDSSLRAAIFSAAAKHGILLEGTGDGADAERDALYRRIKRILADPLEFVEHRVFLALRQALLDNKSASLMSKASEREEQ